MKEDTKERVYSPLFDEIEKLLPSLKKNDPFFYGVQQWTKVTDELHLGYLIKPTKLHDALVKFYGETLPGVTSQIIGTRTAYGELVKQDLMGKMTAAAADINTGTPITIPAINEVSKGVGWHLYRGEVWFGDVPQFSANYDRLKPYSKGLPATFLDYFSWWKDKSKDDKALVDYRNILKQAIDEAESLRKLLAKKLERRLGP